jgi:hypothetical protein
MESENPVIELEPTLRTIYPLGYEFNDRELSAWQSMLNAVGATNITPWSREESQVNKISKFQIYLDETKKTNK